MYRLAYRHFVGPSASQNYESWLVTHSVANGGTGAARWYEFRDPLQSGNPRLYQQGTYAPDAAYRWMGSIAQDTLGNIALGYSRSGSTLYPDIYFTGRVPSDPLGTMETEAAIIDQNVATGSQQGTNNRWGDYSNMGIDNDGCTFVYSQQYYTIPDSTFAWSTRVATFKFPGCH